jgi:hypothetical protein
MCARLIRFCTLGILALAARRDVFAQSKLLSWSPFDAPRSQVAAPVESPFEYLGFIETAEGFQFRIRDRMRKVAAFTKLDVPNDELGAVTRAYDPVGRTLTLEHHGRLLTLPEPKAKVRSSTVVPRRHAYLPLSAPNPNVPRAVTDAVVFQPTPAQEAGRLEGIAAEVQRRRKERERAAAAAAAR